MEIGWDETQDQDFLAEMAAAAKTKTHTAENLVPKGGKAIKGAKASPVDEEEFSAVSKAIAPKKPAAPKKPKARKASEGANDGDEEGVEEVLEFGLGGTPNAKPTADKKPPAKKQKRPTVSIDSSEIPTGKITLPSGSSAGDELEEAMMEDGMAEDDDSSD